MKSLGIFFFFLLFIMLISFPKFSSKDVFNLTSEEENTYLVESKNGNINAIDKLHKYYHYSLNDNNRSIEILRVGANTGNAKFQYKLSLHLLRTNLHSNTEPNKDYTEEGIYWLEKSAKQGHKDALSNLKDYNNSKV